MATVLISSNQPMLDAITPLQEAGAALHWLYPRSKRPIGEKWSEANVASLELLRATYRPGNNVGVRLGEASRLADGYLHAFDVDIRIAERADEAWAAFATLFPDHPRNSLPEVRSGSGGESRHLYFVTDKPFRSKMLAHSDGKHRGKDGKWHYDYEIELFGTGKQVAAPGSIHPDTGKPYTWVREFEFDGFEQPFIAASHIESLGAINTDTFEFELRDPLEFRPGQLEADLDLIQVSDLHYDDWIRLGQALHHQFGGSQEGFDLWLQHTRRSTKFTGDAQIREMRRIKWRSFGKYRGNPVTMGTVRAWANTERQASIMAELDDLPDDDLDAEPAPPFDSDSSDFDDLLTAEPATPKSDDDVFSIGLEEFHPISTDIGRPMTSSELLSVLDIDKEKGAIRGTLHNVEMIVRYDERLWGLAQINEFTQETVQRTPPGYRKKKRRNQSKENRQLSGRVWEVGDTLNGELWSDDRDFAIRTILEAPQTQGGWGLKIPDRDLKAAIVLAANAHAFHPVREYLNGVADRWDGTTRVERLWIDYVGSPDDQYHRDTARLMMVAAVARIFEPGAKFDYATILEGLQGKRKTTLVETLGRRWFAELAGEFGDEKMMIEKMQGAWIMEIRELTGFSRADVRAIKAFISRRKDRARLAYARRAGEFPRQCIFIGTTNDREYLKDDTGGRRFWPIRCYLGTGTEIDIELLEQNIDQLWGEAVILYRQMRDAKPTGALPLYLTDPTSRTIAARLQESRRLEGPDDVMAGRIAEWLDMPVNNGSLDEDFDVDGRPQLRNEVCTAMIWVECLGKDLASFKTIEQGSVNRSMSKIEGWDADGSHRFGVYGKQRRFSRGGEEGRGKREILKLRP